MSDAEDEQYGTSFARSGEYRDESDPQGGSLHDSSRKHYKERRREEEEGDEEEEDDDDDDDIGDDEEGDDDDEGTSRGGKRQKVISLSWHKSSTHCTDVSASADTSVLPSTVSLT